MGACLGPPSPLVPPQCIIIEPVIKMTQKDVEAAISPALPSELKWDQIKWFIPNVIDYTRIIFVLGAACTWSLVELNFVAAEVPAILYLLNHVLDDLDGIAARHWLQCSKFGETLDMVIDVASCVVFEAGIMTLYGLWLMPLYMLSTLIDVAMLALVLTTRNEYWKVLVGGPESPWILRLCFADGSHTWSGEALWKVQWSLHIYLYLAHYYPTLWNTTLVTLMSIGFILCKYQYVMRISFFLQSWTEQNRNTKGDQPPTVCKQGAAAE